MQNNQLSGTIPQSFGQLASLSTLYVVVPAGGLGSVWHHFMCRYLNNNNLSGPIPAEVGQMSSLTVLYVRCLRTFAFV